MRRTRFFRQWFLLLTILSLTATGCGLQDFLAKKDKNSSTSGSNQEQKVIGMILDDSDPNQILVKQGIEEMAGKENVKAVNLSSAQNTQNQNTQNQNTQDQSNKEQKSENNPLEGAKVLIYQGASNNELLNQAQKAGIPVVALGQIPSGAKLAGIVYPNQEGAGQAMASTLQSNVTEGDVAILQQNPDDTGSQEMLAGIQAVLNKNSKIVTHVIINPADSESVAKQEFTALVQDKGEKLKGVLAFTEELASQASEVLKKYQLEKKVSLVGGQANVQSLERINGGLQKGDIDISPYLQGVQAYQMASKLLNAQTVDVDDSVVTDQGMVPAKKIPVKTVDSGNVQLVQKNYAKAVAQAEQAEKQKTDKTSGQKEQTAAGQDKGSSTSKADAGQGEEKSAGQNGSGEQGKSQSGQSSQSGGTKQEQSTGTVIPSEATKVREKVKTETTREYLDKDGKVIGTEQSTVEENRTVSPQDLKQTGENKGGQSQGTQSGDGGQGAGGAGGGAEAEAEGDKQTGGL